MKISVITEGAEFRILSDSGKTYTIRYAGSGDADPEYLSLWECDCPAGQYNRTCKHMSAFLASRLMDVGDPYFDGENLPREIHC